MVKKLALTASVFLLVGVLTFVAAWATDTQDIALPNRIDASTPCPVAGCTQPDGGCHVNEAYPSPDGSFEMECPRRKGCTDVSCHAWDRIDATRSKPSDASMNLWIVLPVVLVLVLMKMGKKN